MKKMSKFLAGGLIVCLLVFCTSIVAGADKEATPADDMVQKALKAQEERQAKAKAVAKDWCLAAAKADTAKVMALSTTPFAWDGKEIFETAEELEANVKKELKGKAAEYLEQDLGESKEEFEARVKKAKEGGAPAVTIKTIAVESDKKTTVDDCVPSDRIVVKMTVVGYEKPLFFCVIPGKEFKVAGIKD